jgi:hypothetical protein
MKSRLICWSAEFDATPEELREAEACARLAPDSDPIKLPVVARRAAVSKPIKRRRNGPVRFLQLVAPKK